MYGRNVEQTLQVVDSVIVNIPEFYNVSAAQQLGSITRQFDSIMSTIVRIENNIYGGKTNMHNSIGSPYVELHRLQAALHTVIGMDPNTVPHLRIQLMLSKVHQLAIDAKQSLLLYGNFVEHGYSYIQNAGSHG